MRRAALLVALAVAAAGAVGTVGTTPAGAATAASSLSAGQHLAARHSLRSAGGAYTLTLLPGARVVLRDRAGHWLWYTRSYRVSHAQLDVRPHGDVVLAGAGRTLWETHTAGVGTRARLVVGDDGTVVVRTPWATAWSSRYGSRCAWFAAGRRILVDLSEQYAWMCRGPQQVQTTRITSGAVDRGMGTPTGTWHLQAKQHDRYLYPAAGGAYFVHYWLPYDGDYGLHDSSWQTFPYGSPRYRTDGSHGCVHVPLPVLRWLDAWAPLGTTVRIRA